MALTDKLNIYWQIIKLSTKYYGHPVVINAWEVLDFGVIVETEDPKQSSKGFFRLEWKDFPEGIDVNTIRSLGNHRTEM